MSLSPPKTQKFIADDDVVGPQEGLFEKIYNSQIRVQSL